MIDVTHPLIGGAANLSSMFESLAVGPPVAVQQSAYDSDPALEQAAVAVRSPQDLTAVVDGLYVNLLGRAPRPGRTRGASTPWRTG